MKFYTKSVSHSLLIIFLLAFLINFNLYSQKENYNWIFPNNTGITFLPDGKTPKVLTDVKSNPIYNTTSSFSDKNGNLLFYTDGRQIFNKNHNVMPNGDMLVSLIYSFYKDALIIQKPNDENLFYVFIMASTNNPPYVTNEGIFYSMVDMRLNGGLGGIVFKDKNLIANTCKYMAGYDNGKGVTWLVFESTEKNQILSYKISSTGLDTVPVCRYSLDSTRIHKWYNDGWIRINKDGNKIAIVPYDNILIETYDFDNISGVVSNRKVLKHIQNNTDKGITDYAYGIEFSPDSKLLYAVFGRPASSRGTKAQNGLLQFDLTSKDTNDFIVLHKDTIDNEFDDNYHFNDLLIGPNDKIYLSKGISSFGVINNPNIKGKGCNFVKHDIIIDSTTFFYKMPNFVIRKSVCNNTLKINAKNQNICINDSINLILDYDYPGNYKCKWSTGDSTNSIRTNKKGIYYLIVTNDQGCRDSATISITNVLNGTSENSILYYIKSERLKDTIRLTPDAVNTRGAVWINKKINVADGFSTNFDFKFTNGSNANCDDKSEKGADGIAVVLQNSTINSLGLYGGGIGYDGIENAIAFEFDTFKNDSTELDDLEDPNGNHFAIQSSKNVITSKHSLNNTIIMNKEIPILKNDVTYNITIDYNIEPKTLRVFIDSAKKNSTMIAKISNFDFSKYIDLDGNKFSYIGITSSTGCSYAKHDIFNWDLCYSSFFVSVDENSSKNPEIISPNPASDYIKINVGAGSKPALIVEIFNIFGETVEQTFLSVQDGQTGMSDPLKIDISNLAPGVYFIRTGDRFEKFIKW